MGQRRLTLPGSIRFTAIIAAGSLLAGCGSSATVTDGNRSNPRASASAVAVVRAWSDALRHGDVRRAAGYFALPSKMVNGPDATGEISITTIRTRADAFAANAALPCGAELVSADQRGRFVNALFRLTDRGGAGGGCGAGIGQTARTDFVIVNGRIVEWIRAPDLGGNGGPTPPGPGAPPSNPATAGPLV